MEGFKVCGKVIIKETGKGIPNIIVEALDKDLIFDDRLGSVITDKDGNFEILYDKEDFQELFFDFKPDIYLRVRKSDGTIIHKTNDKVRYEADKTEEFIIKISKDLIQKEENNMDSGKNEGKPIPSRIIVKLSEERKLEEQGLELLKKALTDFPETKVNPLICLKPERISELVRKAKKRNKELWKIKNLNLFYRVECELGTNIKDLVKALNQLDFVERAYVEPFVSPPTPDFQGDQGYLDAAPDGVNATAAWALPGGRGEGINFIDLEGGWTTDHEDLIGNSPTLIHGAHTPGWIDHGTAVLGEIIGVDNGFGVTGIANNPASVRLVSLEPGGVADAIMAAVDVLNPGDVLLLEVQKGWVWGVWYPTEMDEADFIAIQLAVALGIVVVEAAGNGNETVFPAVGNDLDAYTDPITVEHIFDPTVRDSGAIIVGAGTAGTHEKCGFSNYGTRVNCQGWGDWTVVTCGYGDLYDEGTVQTEYTDSFAGTSSASPMVVGVALCIEGIAENSLGYRFSPAQIRHLVSTFGTPQGGDTSQHIGSLPDLALIIPEIGILPDIYLRDNAADSGEEPQVGSISASPDIILRKDPVADPQTEFGLGTYNDNTLGHMAEFGQDNYIYIRLQNRGNIPNDATVHIYWSPVSSFVDPSSWNYIGDIIVPDVAPGDFKVSDALVWPSAEVPAEGHYCFVGVVDCPLDPAPPIPTFGDINDFYDYIRNNNNVTWRNFNVEDIILPPTAPMAVELPFLIQGAGKQTLNMGVEVIKVLPKEINVELEVPQKLIKQLDISPKRFSLRAKEKVVRCPVGVKGIQNLQEVKLRRGVKYPSKLIVNLSKDTPGGDYYVAVRQTYERKEVGRVTWMLRVHKKESKHKKGK